MFKFIDKMVQAVCGFKDSSGKFHDTKEAAEKADVYNALVKIIDAIPKNRSQYGYYDIPSANQLATAVMDNFDVAPKSYVAKDECKCETTGI